MHYISCIAAVYSNNGAIIIHHLGDCLYIIIIDYIFLCRLLAEITGYSIVIESYLEYATDDNSLFIIHALDENKVIVDFAQFTDRIRSREAEIFQRFGVCNLTRIIVSI